MITYQTIDLSELKHKGKNYLWQRPRCHTRTWGHGFITRFFEEVGEFLYVKRFRCPQCGRIFTVLPKGYFSRYQTSIKNIYTILQRRIKLGYWSIKIPRQRAGHWLRKLSVKARMDFPMWSLDETLHKLYRSGINFLI